MSGVRRRVAAPGLYGAPYAYASVAVPEDAVVFLAGACPIDAEGVVPEPDDLGAQARRAVANLAEVLRIAGCGFDDIVKTTVYVATADRAELVAVWNVVREALGGVDPPSTLVGVSLLGYPGQRVEVEAVAAVPSSQI